MSGKRQVGAGPSGGKEGGDGPVRKRPRAGEVSKSLFDQLNEQDRRQAQQNVQVFPDSDDDVGEIVGAQGDSSDEFEGAGGGFGGAGLGGDSDDDEFEDDTNAAYTYGLAQMRGQGGATPDVESQAGEERAQEEEEGAEAAALASGPVVVNLGEEGQEAARAETPATPGDQERQEAMRLARERRALQVEMHKTHLLLLLANGMLRNKICNDRTLQTALVSMLPAGLERDKTQTDSFFRQLMQWFHLTFGKPAPNQAPRIPGGDVSKADFGHAQTFTQLVAAMHARVAARQLDQSSCAMAFVALCRGLGMETRLVVQLPALPLKPPKSGAGDSPSPATSRRQSSNARPEDPRESLARKMGIKKQRGRPRYPVATAVAVTSSGVIDLTADDDIQIVEARPPPPTPLCSWAEVYRKRMESWTPVDVVNQSLGDPAKIAARAAVPVLYVMAFDRDGRVKDLSGRYAPDWHTKAQKQRVDQKWWGGVLVRYLPKSTDADRMEDALLQSQHLAAELPTSIGALKNHPLYVLERHLGKREMLYPPRKPKGYVRGEPVYSREDVHKLMDKMGWLRQGRSVKEGEEPAREETRSGKDGDEEPQRGVRELFGIWQTEKYKAPEAKGGRVPTNEYGRVELFHKNMLPRGCVQIQLPKAWSVAKKLGIHYATAVTGFSFSGGTAKPVEEGIVVCKEFADVIKEGWVEMTQARMAAAEEKRANDVLSRWRRMVRFLLIRDRLRSAAAAGTARPLASNQDRTSTANASRALHGDSDDDKDFEAGPARARSATQGSSSAQAGKRTGSVTVDTKGKAPLLQRGSRRRAMEEDEEEEMGMTSSDGSDSGEEDVDEQSIAPSQQRLERPKRQSTQRSRKLEAEESDYDDSASDPDFA